MKRKIDKCANTLLNVVAPQFALNGVFWIPDAAEKLEAMSIEDMRSNLKPGLNAIEVGSGTLRYTTIFSHNLE